MLVQGGRATQRQQWTADYTLGKVLLEVIDSMLERGNFTKDDIDRIAVHRGPGHFSALRSGIVTASGLAMAWKKPLVEISAETEEEQLWQVETNLDVPTITPRYIKE